MFPVLWQLRSDLAVLVEHLSLLVGENSFYSSLSAPGDGCLPARNLAVLFTSSTQFLELAKQLETSLTKLFEAPPSVGHRDGNKSETQTEAPGAQQATQEACAYHVELKIESVLPHVLGLLARMGRECMMPLASNVLRSAAELTWLRADASVGARIESQQEVCGRSIEDLLFAPLCFWPRHVDAGVAIMEEITQSLGMLPLASRNREWLHLALKGGGLDELRYTSELCEQGSQDVGGYLHTLEQVPDVSAVLTYSDGSQTGTEADPQQTRRGGMQTLAPVPHAYVHACAGTHHRVLLRITGDLLPAAARMNDVSAGTAIGRPCAVTIFNDVLLVSLCEETAHNESVAAASSTTTIFYLPETLIVRIRSPLQSIYCSACDVARAHALSRCAPLVLFSLSRGLGNRPYTVVIRTQDDCAPQMVCNALTHMQLRVSAFVRPSSYAHCGAVYCQRHLGYAPFTAQHTHMQL